MKESSIKVGVIAEQTGALSFLGIANANVAKMVIDDINAKGGLLGRQIDLHLEDGATTDSVAAAKATRLVQHDHVDVIFGGIYSSTRQAIKGPAVVKGKTLYIYPEQYEGRECDPLIFCTGPVPAQQLEPLIPWLMQQTGAKKFYLPSADYIWPHIMNKKVRELATANGGAIVGEEYFPLDHTDYSKTIDKITSSGAEVVFQYVKQEDVIKALDHAKIAAGPGGPAEMVPGQHHVRMNMYIAQADNGHFKIVKSLGPPFPFASIPIPRSGSRRWPSAPVARSRFLPRKRLPSLSRQRAGNWMRLWLASKNSMKVAVPPIKRSRRGFMRKQAGPVLSPVTRASGRRRRHQRRGRGLRPGTFLSTRSFHAVRRAPVKTSRFAFASRM